MKTALQKRLTTKNTKDTKKPIKININREIRESHENNILLFAFFAYFVV